MRVGSLFAGIGGFELAAQWAGLEPVWSNEIDPFCCQVLRKNFKHRIIEDDIRNIGKHNIEPVDILTGGFPCQPFSVAGKRKGKEDDRFLWPEMLRVIREVKPRWVVGENVTGIIGMALDQVLTEMENIGYDTETYIIPACGISAPHRRNRVWIIAYSAGHGYSDRFGKGGQPEKEEQGTQQRKERHQIFRERNGNNTERVASTGIVTDTERQRQPRQGITNGSMRKEADRTWKASWSDNDGRWPTQSPVRIGNDGLSTGMVRSALKGAGNAIVPQIALEIFKAIKEVELVD